LNYSFGQNNNRIYASHLKNYFISLQNISRIKLLLFYPLNCQKTPRKGGMRYNFYSTIILNLLKIAFIEAFFRRKIPVLFPKITTKLSLLFRLCCD
jgi:hypothetical protein